MKPVGIDVTVKFFSSAAADMGVRCGTSERTNPLLIRLGTRTPMGQAKPKKHLALPQERVRVLVKVKVSVFHFGSCVLHEVKENIWSRRAISRGPAGAILSTNHRR